MIDIFMYCDLAGVEISARGVTSGREVDDILRVSQRIPADCPLVIDVRGLFGLSDSDALRLHAAAASRESATEVRMVDARDPVSSVTGLDAA